MEMAQILNLKAQPTVMYFSTKDIPLTFRKTRGGCNCITFWGTYLNTILLQFRITTEPNLWTCQ